MSGNCQTLELSGPIERIKASYSNDKRSVSSVQYYKGGIKKTYGTLLNSYRTWTFGDSNVLLGLHGKVDGKTIKKLGFIALDTEMSSCPVEEAESEITTEETTNT